MPSINKVILIGNLGQDPECRETSSGAITTLSLATTRTYKNASSELIKETEWHRVVFFGRTAEVARDYLKKGSSAYVEGRLRSRKYTDKEGIERTATEIVGEMLQLLGGKPEGGQNANASSTAPKTQKAPPAQSNDPWADYY